MQPARNIVLYILDRFCNMLKRVILSFRFVSWTVHSGRRCGSFLRRTLHQGINDVLSAQLGQDFLTTVTFGSETREAVLDTGSSDSWLVETGFTCVNSTSNATIPEAECYFGEPMPRQSSFKMIEDENFNVSYADGEYLPGDLGYEEITIAGIKIARQEVALTFLAGWNGGGISSGLLGLALPSFTEAFSGTNASADEIATFQSPKNDKSGQILFNHEHTLLHCKLDDPYLHSCIVTRRSRVL